MAAVTLENLSVGCTLAKKGAWNRKYKVLSITEVPLAEAPNPHPNVEYDLGPVGTNVVKVLAVRIEFVGDYYADGTALPSKKKPQREVYFELYEFENGSTRILETNWLGYDTKRNKE